MKDRGDVHVDLDRLAYVLDGESEAQKRSRLIFLLGTQIINAVRAIAGAGDVGTAVSRLARANLSEGLAETLDLFDVLGESDSLTSHDVAAVFGVSVSTASTRLTQLESVGLVVCMGYKNRVRVFRPAILEDGSHV